MIQRLRRSMRVWSVPSARARRPPVVAELGVIAFLLVAYDRITALVAVHVPEAVDRGREILALEARVHLAVEDGLDHALAPHLLLSRAASVYYDFAHATVTIGVMAALYLLCPGNYRRARRALVGVNLVALLVFALAPVAPPRLVPGAGFVDVVSDSHTWGSWEGSSAAHHANAYAATPSLHVAWAVWVLLAVCSATKRRLARTVAAVHVAATTTIVVATGNHYLLDVAAGALLSLGVWALAVPAGELAAAWAQRRQRERGAQTTQ